MKALLCLSLILTLGSCSTLPTDPSILVLPGTDKNLTMFHADDVLCRQFAYGQVLASSTERDDARDQQVYDMSYMQCMYEKGHRVPVPAEMSYETIQDWHVPPPSNTPPPQ